MDIPTKQRRYSLLTWRVKNQQLAYRLHAQQISWYFPEIHRKLEEEMSMLFLYFGTQEEITGESRDV